MTPAAKRLQMILGSVAFDALEEYLRERESPKGITPEDAPARVISRTVTDDIQTKDGA